MALKPKKHIQGELFVCDITDVILKGDMASMEHPFYSLSKRPDREPRRYQQGDKWIEFRPSIKGLPTIYDKDLIIFAISQIVAAKNEAASNGELMETPSEVVIDPYNYLVSTQRGTGGKDYDALCDSLDRIDGTRFRTNVLFEGTRADEWFGIIDRARLETDEKTRKPRKLTIRLSDYVLNAIDKMDVLTLHGDYFRLAKPIERRLYELVRKHMGRQREWAPFITTLHNKSGSRASLKEFRRMLRPLVTGDYLPDFTMEWLKGETTAKDKIVFRHRTDEHGQTWFARSNDSVEPSPPPVLSFDIYSKAREVAPTYDPRFLEDEWRAYWDAKGRQYLHNPDGAFLKFCASRYRAKPNP